MIIVAVFLNYHLNFGEGKYEGILNSGIIDYTKQ